MLVGLFVFYELLHLRLLFACAVSHVTNYESSSDIENEKGCSQINQEGLHCYLWTSVVRSNDVSILSIRG